MSSKKLCKIQLITLLIIVFILIQCKNEGSTPTLPVPGNGYGFPSDFPVIIDQGGLGCGGPIFGFGGDVSTNKEGNRSLIPGKRPIILIHGNGANADMAWKNYFRVWLKNYGYNDAQIWALSYHGKTGQMESYCEVRNNINDVRNFIDAVINYLGVSKVDIIGHSLGGQLLRAYLLGFQSNGIFNNSQRRLDKVGAAILISSSNYGLGVNHPNPDKDSDGQTFNTSQANNFTMVDGVVNLTPNSPTIRYIDLYLKK